MLTVLPAQKDGEFVFSSKKEATGKLQALLRGQTHQRKVMIDVIDIKYYTNHDNSEGDHDPLQHVIFFTRADLTMCSYTTKEGVTRAAVFARYGRADVNYHDYCFNDIVEDSGTGGHMKSAVPLDNPDPTIHFTGVADREVNITGVSGARASMVAYRGNQKEHLRMKTPVELMSR
ncbi:hypothetical protein SPFM9_00266 [Salmonella phage SPFM9]|nr:hypothetical protein SPFM9_00266 [Salmonella phage SPFM9]